MFHVGGQSYDSSYFLKGTPDFKTFASAVTVLGFVLFLFLSFVVYLLSVYLYVWPTYRSLYHVYLDDIGSPGSGITDTLEPPVGAESQTQVLWESSQLLPPYCYFNITHPVCI